MTKMTYVAALNYVLTSVADLPADVTEKLTALRDQTEKRNTADRKPTKTQVANEALKAKVGRMNYILDNLVAEGKAVKVPVKRVNKFARA